MIDFLWKSQTAWGCINPIARYYFNDLALFSQKTSTLDPVTLHMSVLKFDNSGSYFEMSVAMADDPLVQNCGDAYITIDVLSDGFKGHNDLWVLGEAFSAFCAALISLEHSLKGEATLESISPNELKLRIFSVNNRGHLAVECCTGYWSQNQEGSFWHSVSFGFSFEPQQLTKAISAPWVRIKD